jgi:hypothetical protein
VHITHRKVCPINKNGEIYCASSREILRERQVNSEEWLQVYQKGEWWWGLEWVSNKLIYLLKAAFRVYNNSDEASHHASTWFRKYDQMAQIYWWAQPFLHITLTLMSQLPPFSRPGTVRAASLATRSQVSSEIIRHELVSSILSKTKCICMTVHSTRFTSAAHCKKVSKFPKHGPLCFWKALSKKAKIPFK